MFNFQNFKFEIGFSWILAFRIFLFLFLANEKHKKLQSSIVRLKHKHQQLEIAIEEQKKKLAQYESLHSVICSNIFRNSYSNSHLF